MGFKDFLFGNGNDLGKSKSSSTRSSSSTRQTSAPRPEPVNATNRGIRALDGIFYFCDTKPYDWDYNYMRPRAQIRSMGVDLRSLDKLGDANGKRGVGLSGYAGTKILTNKDGKNDIVALTFYIQDNEISKDSFGRLIDGELFVLIDAADYDKLDIAGFIKQTDADIKQCVAKGMSIYDICDRYPLTYNDEAERVGKPKKNFNDGFKVEEKGVVKTHVPPKTKNYERAMRTKDGTLVTGSLQDLGKGM